MAVTVLTVFEDFGNRTNTGAEWAGVLNPPTSMNFDTGTITTAASGNGLTFKAALRDPGTLLSDAISSVLVTCNFVLTSSDAAGGLRGRDPTAAGDTYPSLIVPSNAGAAADILGTTSGSCSIELIPDFWGTSTITREELFFLVPGGTNARWWQFTINSRHSGAFAAFDVRLQISNFTVTVTDDSPDPAVTSVVPNSGPTEGGQAVTIRGAGLNAATGVTFGGEAATDVVIVSNTVITCTTPVHASGVVDVVVLGVGTGTNLYTYVVTVPQIPGPPYTVPVLQDGRPHDRIAADWHKWLLRITDRVNTPPSAAAENVTGVFAVSQIPTLPWTRVSKTGSSLADLETRSASDLTSGVLRALRGGTGFGGYAVGDVLYADTAYTLARLADVSAGSYLRSGGVAAVPVWSTLKLPNAATAGDILFATSGNTYASQAPEALTKVDDTNVTLTLGGTPATSLVKAVSLTLGWTGTLSVARGGTGTGTTLTQGSVVFAGASGVFSQDNANFFWDDTANRLGIGTVTPGSSLTIVTPTDVPIETHSPFAAGASLYTHSGTAFRAPAMELYRSRGTQSSPTVVSDGDHLGYLTVYGYNSGDAAYLAGFGVSVRASGDWSVAGTRTATATVSVGAITLLNIANDGTVGFGVGALSGYQARFNGPIAANAAHGLSLFALNADVTTAIGTTPRVIGETNTSSQAHLAGLMYGANSQAVWISGLKTRSAGDNSADTVVQDGDGIVRVEGWGADGAAYRSAGYLELQIDGTPGSSDMPGRWVVYTTPDGSATPAERLRVTSSSLLATVSILSNSATAGVGYASGAGGTVAQATSKATGVTLNKVTGLITMDAAALAADTTVSFTLTNSTIAATDTILLQHDSAGTAGAYTLNAQPAAGTAAVSVRNVTAGSLSEAIVLRFTVLKSVSA